MTPRLLRLSACCLVLCAVALPAARAATPAAAVEPTIARLEREWNDAYGANQLAKYFAAYADDAVLIFDQTRTPLAEYRKSWTESVKTSPLESVQLADLVIRVAPSGDTAVASYRIDVHTRHADGKSTVEHAFETDVWQKRGDAWKVVHVHYAVAPAK